MENKPVTDGELKLARYDEDLDFTQAMRRRLVEDMTKDDQMPQKPSQQQMLIQALDSMDNQTFKRIEREEGDAVGGAIAAEVTAFMKELAKSSYRDPFRVSEAKPRELEHNLPDVSDASEFELSQTTNFGKTEYDEFTNAFLDENPDYRD